MRWAGIRARNVETQAGDGQVKSLLWLWLMCSGAHRETGLSLALSLACLPAWLLTCSQCLSLTLSFVLKSVGPGRTEVTCANHAPPARVPTYPPPPPAKSPSLRCGCWQIALERCAGLRHTTLTALAPLQSCGLDLMLFSHT